MAEESGNTINVAGWERWTSAFVGGALVTYGLLRRDKAGAGLAVLGGGLLYRGSTGHCSAYSALGVATTANGAGQNGSRKSVADAGSSLVGPKGVQNEKGIKVKKAITIGKPAEELYNFWRRFENLPKFMQHLESVTEQDGGKSHWVAKAPFGKTVQWDAQIINETPNELIAWKSLPGADVESAGSVTFKPGPQGRGTEVHVSLSYQPPAGQIGAAVAKLFGEEPNQQVDNDLRHFKNLMETGSLPTTDGQSAGKRSLSAKALRAAVENKIK
jgi:uncharacterized membrane protein